MNRYLAILFAAILLWASPAGATKRHSTSTRAPRVKTSHATTRKKTKSVSTHAKKKTTRVKKSGKAKTKAKKP
ncbi:MAG TPA: hypothetical protein VFD13_09625 [Candidatus Kapabacteria bacterium]|nr:hypothetical protein [Candidatus Kapabacteria bacterium]